MIQVGGQEEETLDDRDNEGRKHDEGNVEEELTEAASHDPELFGRTADTYGMIRLQSNNPEVDLFAEALRLRFRSDGYADFSVPTTVR